MRRAVIVAVPVGVLGLGQIVAFASSFYLLGVLADPIARDLHVSTGLLFGLLSFSFLISALVSPRTGRWLDRHGGRGMLLASSLVFGLGLILLAMAQGPATLTAGMLAMGAGMAIGLYEVPFAILVAIHGQAARRPITAVALLGGLGSSIGWPATLALQQAFGWRGACLGWAAAHILICLPLGLLLVPDAKPAPHADPARPPPPPGNLWDRRMVQLAVLFAGAWFVSTCMAAHLPRLLTKVGLSPAAAVATAALVGLAAVTARLLEFTVLKRLPPLATTRAASLMHPLGAAAVLLFGAKAGALLALGQGTGNGMLTVAKGVLPLTLFGPDNYGYRSGLLSTPARFAQALGPLAYGLVLDRSATWALLLTGGVCLGMFAMTFGLKESAPP